MSPLFSNNTFSHSVKGDILHVTYTGKIKSKEMQEIMSKIYKLIDLHGSKKILIDALKSDVHLEVHEIVPMAKAHPASFKEAKTAVVEKPKKQSQYSLYEVVAENNNTNLRFFPDFEQAKAWLTA